MTTAPPPVPPANRSDKGPGDAQRAPKDTAGKGTPPGNTAQQDHQGNVRQNTTNQGHQQDR